jgi:hypothetical protein
MTHGRFSLTLLLTLILASFVYARAQSSPAEETKAAAPNPEPQAPATLKGEGTAGRIPKFTGQYLLGNSVITENDKGLLGINNTNPFALLHMYEAPQPSSITHGTAAPNLIHTTGGRGGATTSGGGWTAGRGASIVLTAGNGGDAPSGSTTGDGGSLFLRPGVPGGGGGFQGKFGKVVIADQWGAVGIGTSTPNLAAKMNIKTTVVSGTGLLVQSEGAGISSFGTYGNGVSGYSVYGSAIYGTTGSSSAFAGKFIGNVQVSAGTLTVNGNVCASNHPCNSDARLKVGIAGLNYGLRHLLQLRPVTWKWKEEPTGPLQLGLVAQEVEPVMPALVMRDADASKPLGLNYMGLLPVIVKAVQEQQAELESRDARIAELRAQVEQLEREKKSEVEALRAENEAVKARLDALERAVTKSADGGQR